MMATRFCSPPSRNHQPRDQSNSPNLQPRKLHVPIPTWLRPNTQHPIPNANFQDIWEAFISTIGIKALNYRTGRESDSREVRTAFDKKTTESFFYNPFCICRPIYLCLVEKDPPVYVGAGTLREIRKAADCIDKTLEKVAFEEFEGMYDWEV